MPRIFASGRVPKLGFYTTSTFDITGVARLHRAASVLMDGLAILVIEEATALNAFWQHNRHTL